MTHDPSRPSPRALHELVRHLPLEVEPPPELWQRIATRLETPAPRSLEERARDLRADVAPPVDLWPQIAARLRTEPHRPRARARLAAAAAAIAAVGVLVALAVRDQQPVAGGDDTTADDGNADSAANTALGAAWMLHSPMVSDEVAAMLRRELTLVRDERLTIEAAIDHEPENARLRELWAHTYQIELQLADACSRTIMAYERG